ncbi:camp-dependent protein kinase catalytic subunit [Ascosphaera pollenicola]|nr:camp-dependent protein kinase catalytic subunit [Ascosphaera pollenicola]
MAPKPPHDGKADSQSHSGASTEHKKKGFSVGPANLPDGTYRRKVQKIKSDLIHKAKVRKAYAKIKEKELPAILETSHFITTGEGQAEEEKPSSPKGPELHPDRIAMLNEAQERQDNAREETANRSEDTHGRRKRRPKPSSFEKELAMAKKREEEAERRNKIREENQRHREAMAKARRPDQFGKRRLGRESTVLLQKVKRMVGEV